MNWQPIETAKKDGRPILGWRAAEAGTEFLFICAWDMDGFSANPRPYWRRDGSEGKTYDRKYPPTHWMPLPDPPKEPTQ